jgi:predicted DNA-binding antitoxin AbrB/MazE fold protein
MNDTIAAIYEKGVIRPLEPLTLAEHTRVQIRIVPEATNPEAERQKVRTALLTASVIHPHEDQEQVPVVSEEEMLNAANALGAAGPLSDVIIAAREER